MDRNQFISNVEGIQGEMRRFLTALCCGNKALADDIAQDTLMKAYLSSDSFREPSKFKAWIFRIAYNTFISNRRAERPASDLDEAHLLVAPDVADDAFRYQRLYMALDRLNARERTAVLLFYMQGYSTKEISQTVDAPEATVRQHLSRARIHLKKLLENER